MIIDLDAVDTEEIDTIKLNGVEYEIGNVTPEMMERIGKVDLQSKVSVFDQWRPIVKEILQVRNPDADAESLWRDKIEAFVRYLMQRIRRQQNA